MKHQLLIRSQKSTAKVLRGVCKKDKNVSGIPLKPNASERQQIDCNSHVLRERVPPSTFYQHPHSRGPPHKTDCIMPQSLYYQLLTKKNSMHEQNNSAETPTTGQAEIENFLKLFRDANPRIPANYSSKKCLKLFRKQTKRTIELFSLFNRPVFNDLSGIQKACTHYIMAKDVSEKDRSQVLESWAKWSEIVMELSRRQSFIAQNLHGNHRLLRKLNRLKD